MTEALLAVAPGRQTSLAAAAFAIENGSWPIEPSQLATLVADLRRSDERTRFALGVARTGVWEAELFTGQVEWSDTMHLAMGHSDFEGTIDAMQQLIHPDDRRKFAKVVHGNFDQPSHFNIDVRVPWPDGTQHWVQLRGQITTDPGGMAVRLVSVAQDITEQKQMELKLRQAQKMEAMGRLAGGVAHDFNNILTAILGYAMLIETDTDAIEASREQASQVRKAAERASSLTKQLLAFSRRQVIDRRRVYVCEIITDVLSMLTKILGEQVRIVHNVDAGTHPVFADAGQLQQILMNLAINARDAMPNGGQLSFTATNVRLDGRECVARFKLAAGDYVALTVSDTGTGMDASTREQIFDPFFTTKEVGLGTGLGLSNVYETVKQLGGGIRVASAPGEGTTFQIFLPRCDETAEQPLPSTAAVIGGSETVLVVEDEEGVRLLVQSVLERNGYSVLAAQDAPHARRIIADPGPPIDLVLSDVMMPDGTGPELIESLSTGRAAGARALYMSGYAGAVLAQQGRLAADSEFLQKPFSGPQLLAKVRQLLDVTSRQSGLS
ncbi:MAG TPA: ATP-binding protein [Vicinamibacterales bacterium]|nr:ATP-binding protein [Vicinamibacterales bacterium]